MSDEYPQTDNVVTFNPVRTRSFVQKESADPKARLCSHDHVFVSRHHRMLECKACHAMVDPFDWIWKWAREETQLTMETEELKKRRTLIKEEIAMLAAERDRLMMGNNKLKRQARAVEVQE